MPFTELPLFGASDCDYTFGGDGFRTWKRFPGEDDYESHLVQYAQDSVPYDYALADSSGIIRAR